MCRATLIANTGKHISFQFVFGWLLAATFIFSGNTVLERFSKGEVFVNLSSSPAQS